MRKDAREVVFKVLYSELYADVSEELFSDLSKEADLTESEVTFACSLLKSSREKKDVLDGIIGELANNYDLKRIYPTDKCALYIGLTEIMGGEVPYIVAIDEALSLCKKYSTPESLGFVNGIFAEYVKRNKIA
ncbi:MAG: transcription antitermination protein NusB [Clostridia bacterium]|nr:transcription antitermination protein NusB [Clostridia bacterium]